MIQYLRNLDEIPGFSDIPLSGHEKAKTVNKILIDPATGAHNFLLLWAKHEPGSRVEKHTHPVEQAYFVLSGELQVHIAGKEHVARANTSVFFPIGAEHAFSVQGEEPAVLLILFAPATDSFAGRPH